MGFFSKNNNAQPMNERQACMAKYNGARGNLLLVVVFTAINIIILLTNSNSYFLFSAAIPYYLVMMGMLLTGKVEELCKCYHFILSALLVPFKE